MIIQANNNSILNCMKKQYTLIFFILSELLSVVHSEEKTDSIFNNAIQMAKNRQYNAAILEAKKALFSDTKRGDILVFIANVYLWENKNDSALMYIQQAKDVGYHRNDFYASWSNILLQDKRYGNLLVCCKEAEDQQYSDVDDLFRKRLIAYTELKYYDKAIRLIEDPRNKKYLDSKKTSDLYSYLLFERNKNIFSVYYYLNMLDNAKILQHIGSLSYTRKSGENRIGISANYANRIGVNFFQLETNIHLKTGAKQYLYFDYGYTNKASIFPQHQGGIEYYFNFLFKTDASIGGRYLYYENLNANIFIVTTHLEKFIYNSWLAVRSYYVYNKSNNKNSYSLVGNYRLFGQNELDYWGIEIDSGNSPDELYSLTQTSGLNQLAAYKIKLEKSFQLNRISNFHLGLSFINEELVLYQYRQRYGIETGYQIRL